MDGLEGRSAIVTGGSTLIGRAVVSELHRLGMCVAIADIDDAPGEAAGDRARGASALPSHRHHRDDEIAALVAATVERASAASTSLVNLACTYLDDGFASPRADWLDGARRQRRQRRR